jgi:hypothetical protein
MFACLIPGAAAAAEPQVQARSSVDRTAIWVADRLTYTIDVVCERGVDILLDDLAKEKLRVNGLEVISSDSSATTDAGERTTHRLRYVMTTYRVDTPALSIEPVSVRYYARRPGQRLQDMAPAGEVVIPGAAVAFRSTLPDNQPSYAMRDTRAAGARLPFFARAESIGFALVIVSIAPALFVLGTAVRRRTVRTSGRRSARQVRKEQRDVLEKLRGLDVGTEEERRLAYDTISGAVREHVAAASGVPAASLTAGELDAALGALDSHRSLRPGARGKVPRETVASLLAACDTARYGPPAALPAAEACRDALATAEQVLAGR